ncbi:uncharacterized protein [Panulirus ornatus]|uniref:uncharacterized protein isoform X2 n=1 Tax=Panulirus ornatus TaxID=150431 RepID=UPI003A8C03FE
MKLNSSHDSICKQQTTQCLLRQGINIMLAFYLAAQLAELKRELHRKEKKLKKYSKVLGAKRHVRDTLRQHNIAHESECNPNSDLVNCSETQTELKCSVSRTVTFSAESPKVIILSPVPNLVNKRKDKAYRYRSLSTRKTQSREREKAVTEVLNEGSRREVFKEEVKSRPLSDGNSRLKYSGMQDASSTVSDVENFARNYNAKFDDSETDSLSDNSSCNDDISVLKQIFPLSNNSGKVVSESTTVKYIETKLPSKEYSAAAETPADCPQNRKRYLSNSCVRCEAASSEVENQTQDVDFCHPHKLNDSIVSWIEEPSDEYQCEGNTNASNNFHNSSDSIKVSETHTTAVDNEKDGFTFEHIQQQKNVLEYKISKQIESQDLFGTHSLTQTENVEIKRNCVSPRRRWKYRTSQTSCSEGSRCGTNDKEETNRKTMESTGQNIIQGVSCDIPLKNLEMQKILSEGEHVNEELMIREMEQEMIKEYNIESSQLENAKGSVTSKETMVKKNYKSEQITNMNSDKRFPELGNQLIPKSRHENIRKVMEEVEGNDNEKLDELLAQKSHETQCKYVDNGKGYKKVNGEEFCENDLSAVIDKISPQKILSHHELYHVSEECEEKLQVGVTLMDQMESDITIDPGFEKVVRSDENGKNVCTSETKMPTENLNGKEDYVNSDRKVYKGQDNSVEKDITFHSLVDGEKHGKILTTSLVSLFHADEEILYILVVKECGFTLWDTIKRKGDTDKTECSMNEKQYTAKGSLKNDIWRTVGEISHHVGRTSDIRDIVAVGLPSDEEVRYLVAFSTTVEADVQIFYVQFSVEDKWLVIKSRLGLSLCNTFKNLAACAVGEWSVAICWTPMEPFTNGYFIITDIDVTYSRRGKRWELQCHSSFRSLVCEEPLGCLIALHQPDPVGIVLYTSNNKLYMYDAVEDIILHQFHWQVAAPSWAVINEDLVFFLSVDTSGQTCLSALNPMNGLQETFFTTLFQDNRGLCDGNSEESSKECCTRKLTCVSLNREKLVVAFDTGAVIHISMDAFTDKNPS